jgi:hypothetical protein
VLAVVVSGWPALGVQEESGTARIRDSGDSMKLRMCDTKLFKASKEVGNS